MELINLMLDRKRRKKRRRLRRFKRPSERVTASIRPSSDDNLHVVIGRREFATRAVKQTPVMHDYFDHVALGLAAISMSTNIEIDLDFPCSEDMARQIVNLKNAYRLWSIDRLAPLRINVDNVVPNQPNPSTRGIICLSGGLDSMGAAVEAAQAGRTSHALLVAGADYASSTDVGFVELEARVRAISYAFGFELVVVETNLRNAGFHWEMLHGFNLGHCLHFLSPQFSHGSFAQDNNAVQDLFRAPWGNLNVLPNLMSTGSFPIETFGKDVDRVGKLRAVLDYNEDLINHLSVCYSDKSIGGNCGRCAKCIQTRSALFAIGRSDQGLFVETPNLADSVKAFSVPERVVEIRGRMTRTSELVNALPDGEVRDAYIAFENKLRDRFHSLMPADT